MSWAKGRVYLIAVPSSMVRPFGNVNNLRLNSHRIKTILNDIRLAVRTITIIPAHTTANSSTYHLLPWLSPVFPHWWHLGPVTKLTSCSIAQLAHTLSPNAGDASVPAPTNPVSDCPMKTGAHPRFVLWKFGRPNKRKIVNSGTSEVAIA